VGRLFSVIWIFEGARLRDAGVLVQNIRKQTNVRLEELAGTGKVRIAAGGGRGGFVFCSRQCQGGRVVWVRGGGTEGWGGRRLPGQCGSCILDVRRGRGGGVWGGWWREASNRPHPYSWGGGGGGGLCNIKYSPVPNR